MPTTEADWGEMFKMMDEKGSGFIPTEKFAGCVRGAGLYPTEAHIKEMLEKAGGDKGQVGYDDFMSQMRWLSNKHPIDIDQVGESFKMFDKDDNGMINKAELHHVLCGMGDKLSSEEAEEFIKEASIDKNGNISYMDFLNTVID
eukprot:CAMPEP_0113614198 /NCGR_PEP_ID=MMETSP0017_2-20120614/7037_1 /TAXON_ID=2856 /ORGANISM="Cylindrotheca closterium" /LENGTH=143 /DNA_ID=CAMNT_0000523347 /DNA_START=123 /DNA_END=554 /DNA_ORIENTATION=+ /assembly_acc=CAM_ASM_000147